MPPHIDPASSAGQLGQSLSDRVVATIFADADGSLGFVSGASANESFLANVEHYDTVSAQTVLPDQAKQMLSSRLAPEEQGKLAQLWSSEGASWEENELRVFDSQEGLYILVLER